MKHFDLQERLINFVMIVDSLIIRLPQTLLMKQISAQLVRSSSSTALNYSEAVSAESHSDFIHKMKIVMKELRETHTCLQIIYRKYPGDRINRLNETLKENDELIAIFSKSIQTALNNKVIKDQQAKKFKS
jgi:four helix bundle protein